MTEAAEERARAIRQTIRGIPRGKVATYAQVAEAAGFPGCQRLVAQVLRASGGTLPWQRVVGAGGAIRLPREAGYDQRVRLEMEGVKFRGRRVLMAQFQHVFQ